MAGLAGGLRGGSRGVRGGASGGSSAERVAASETRPRVRFAGFSSRSSAGGELRRLLLDLVPSLLGPAEAGGAGGTTSGLVDLREGLRPEEHISMAMCGQGQSAYAGGRLV